MSRGTTYVLDAAVNTARREGISTIVVASTTGKTALELCAMVDTADLRIVVVTHGPRRGGERFEAAARKKLSDRSIAVLSSDGRRTLPGALHKLLRKLDFNPWHRKLKAIKAAHGTGIGVCHKILWILIRSGLLNTRKVVAVAGKKQGADSAGVFLIPGEKRKPVLLNVITDRCGRTPPNGAPDQTF